MIPVLAMQISRSSGRVGAVALRISIVIATADNSAAVHLATVPADSGVGVRVSSATLDGTYSPRYLALQRRVSGLRHQLTVPNSVVRRCQTIRQFTPEQQTEQAWCLTIATNAIVTWISEY